MLDFFRKTGIRIRKGSFFIVSQGGADILKIVVCVFDQIKFRYYEKATKFEKISHLFWQNSCFYSVASKQVGDFFKFFVAFSEKLDFTSFGYLICLDMQFFSIFFQVSKKSKLEKNVSKSFSY